MKMITDEGFTNKRHLAKFRAGITGAGVLGSNSCKYCSENSDGIKELINFQ